MSTENALDCEGACDLHVGLVRRVTVLDKGGVEVLGNFDYCLAAIAEDESRGFKVIVEDMS